MPQTQGLDPRHVPYQALAHLANTGPISDTELREAINSLAVAPKATTATNVLHRLVSLGLVKSKCWLTPEGLAELQKNGWTPEREAA